MGICEHSRQHRRCIPADWKLKNRAASQAASKEVFIWHFAINVEPKQKTAYKYARIAGKPSRQRSSRKLNRPKTSNRNTRNPSNHRSRNTRSPSNHRSRNTSRNNSTNPNLNTRRSSMGSNSNISNRSSSISSRSSNISNHSNSTSNTSSTSKPHNTNKATKQGRGANLPDLTSRITSRRLGWMQTSPY